eukprot:SAG22_NODE_9457_length_588_cov_1.546012_1_plen_137_part_10
MFITLLGRPAVATALIGAGVFETAVAQLRPTRSSAVEQACWHTDAGLQATGVMLVVGGICQLTDRLHAAAGVDTAGLLVESGMIDALGRILQAFELLGPSKIADANVCSLVHAVWPLTEIDLRALAAKPIAQRLAGM